jgi:hypothetical protein
MFVVLLILVLIVLSLMFGGFQKGTKSGSLNYSPAPTFTFTVTPAPFAIAPASIAPLTGDYADRGAP